MSLEGTEKRNEVTRHVKETVVYPDGQAISHEYIDQVAHAGEEELLVIGKKLERVFDRMKLEIERPWREAARAFMNLNHDGTPAMCWCEEPGFSFHDERCKLMRRAWGYHEKQSKVENKD